MSTGGFPTYIATNDTYTIVASSGELVRIIVGTTANGAITIADGATTIGVLKANVAEGTYEFGCRFATSLIITTASTSKITVITR